jgi:hypothetical protein
MHSLLILDYSYMYYIFWRSRQALCLPTLLLLLDLLSDLKVLCHVASAVPEGRGRTQKTYRARCVGAAFAEPRPVLVEDDWARREEDADAAKQRTCPLDAELRTS